MGKEAHIKNHSPFKKEGMFNGANPLIFELAKGLRKNMTGAEKLLWNHLKEGINGFKFRRQHPIGIYIADFYCHKLKFIIELDGSIHDLSDVKENDENRERDLKSWGYNIIRFTNDLVFTDIANILLIIKNKVEELESKSE